MILALLSMCVAFLIVIFTTPLVIKIFKEKGITGTDVHKLDRPELPKGGGIVLLFAMVTALLATVGVTTFTGGEISTGLLASLVAILMAGMIGLLDDILNFKNITKIVLPLVASIPMAAMQVGTTKMDLPLVGVVNLGIIYPLVIVPLMMTFIIDSTNMYAGMNGLEAGLAAVNSSAILLYVLFCSLFRGIPLSDSMDTFIISATVMATCLAFLWFNRYPARILSGDVGLLPIGAAMGAALILGNMDRLAIVLYITYGLNFLLYIFYRLQVWRKGISYAKFATVRPDGSLEVIGPYTMYWLIPYLFKNTGEKRNVELLVIIQAIIAYTGMAMMIFVL